MHTQGSTTLNCHNSHYYTRSPILIPWCHIAAWYFVVDLFNMYDAFQAKNDISHLSRPQRLLAYVRAKWPYVVHHVVLFSIGYQVVVVSTIIASSTLSY